MKKALVLTLAFALGLGIAAFAAPLSGEWCADITINPQSQTQTFTAFTSTITVDYTVGGWIFESVTGFTLDGWDTQAFSAVGVLGAFSIGSDLVFAPVDAEFTSWDTTGSVSIAGVAFDGEFLLTAGGSGWTFGASGGAGDLSLGATAYFNMDSDGNLVQTDSYCFCFDSVEFDVSFPFACVDLVDVSLGFSTEGFDGITFAVTGIAIPGLSWFTFDAALTFTTQTDTQKTLTLTPVLTFGTSDCIVLYVDFIGVDGKSCDTSLTISGIEIYGLGLEYSWNGVSFSSLSAFGDNTLADLDDTLSSDYWEVFSITSEADSCCGGGFSFALDTYFACDSAVLFDWAETDASISYGLGSNFTITTGLNVEDAGFTEWSIGFEVTW